MLPRYIEPAFQYLTPKVFSNCSVVSVNPTSSFFPSDRSESVSSCPRILPRSFNMSLR
uniref:Uncharacterized protein n=1 Tax=Arundo donax TaxID=35708 RepID=A0A0A9CXR4_ARUDO